MLKFMCVLLFTVGGLIMLYSIVIFFKLILKLKLQTDSHRILPRWIYMACMMLLMAFFLACYTAIDIIFLAYAVVSPEDLIVSSVAFFGSVFVCIIITTLRSMLSAISKKHGEITKTLINAVEAKDRYTRGHSDHVADITKLIYDYLPDKIKHRINFSRLTDAAILHDVGKIGIIDNILNKPGKLTDEEWDLIKRHPEIGRNIFERTSYRSVAKIIYCHHERIDGKGYYGIPADEIPTEAKIIAVADAYSALCTDRVYRAGKSHDEAVKIISGESGTQFDKSLVDIFCAIPKSKLENIMMNTV